MNYMDYGNDEVLVMFTTDQKDKMEYSLDVVRDQLALPESVGLDTSEKQTVIVYPNPTTNVLHIQHSKPTNQSTVYLIDVTGHLCLTKKASNTGTTFLQVSNLNKGIYFLGLKEGSSSKIVKKIIIQ